MAGTALLPSSGGRNGGAQFYFYGHLSVRMERGVPAVARSSLSGPPERGCGSWQRRLVHCVGLLFAASLSCKLLDQLELLGIGFVSSCFFSSVERHAGLRGHHLQNSGCVKCLR